MRSQTGRMVVRVIAVLLCAASIWISHHLYEKHLAPAKPAAVASDDNLLDKACTAIIPEADCDKAIHSRWGTLWGGVPTAQLGMYYYTFLFWWFLLIGAVTSSRSRVHLLLAVMMAVGLGFSIFLVYQLYKEPPFCTLCLITHAANALLFVCMLLLWPPAAKASPVSAAAESRGTGLFEHSAPGEAGGERDWPSGWALLVMPIVILLAFFAETPMTGAQYETEREQLLDRLTTAQREAQAYKNLAEGKEGSQDIEALQEQIQLMRESRERASQQYMNEIRMREDRITQLTKQQEALQKIAEGKPATAELDKLRTDLQKAEGYRDYYKKQFERYDSQWQHTYTAWLISPPVNISTEHQKIRGPANAPHTVTVYSDFQCPTCKMFEQTLTTRLIPLAARFGGIHIVFKQFPLSPKCNSTAKYDTHPSACDAALAAEAAFILGGNEAFWKMHDLLFAEQDVWKGNPNFDKYATQVGLNLDAFHKAMQSDEAMQHIKADVAEGAALGKDLIDREWITKEEQEAIAVDSTPAVFVDNKRLSSPHHFKTWQKILQYPTPAWQPEVKRPATSRPASRPVAMSTTRSAGSTPPNP